MKKGLSYIDWSISAGIFIIYIIVLFILLGPAFKQDYSPDYLGSLVREGIKENVSLEIKRIPLFIELNTTHTGDGGTRPYNHETSKVKIKLMGNLAGEIINIDHTNKQFSVFNENLTQEFTTKKYESSLTIFEFKASPNQFGISNFYPSREEIIKFWIFLSNEEIFTEINSTWPFKWEAEAFTFGVAETLEGIYEPYFINFTNNDYETAKDIINFPKEREFAIDIYNHTDFTSPILNYTKTQPGEKDIVNTLLWADYLIHNNTQRTPITILIKTW